MSTDFHAAHSTLVSGELAAESSVAQQGDGGEFGLAEHGRVGALVMADNAHQFWPLVCRNLRCRMLRVDRAAIAVAEQVLIN